MEEIRGRLRQYFKKQKGKVHKIEGHPVAKAEEYIQDFYFTILCVAAQNEGELDESQALFIQRLLSGVENSKGIGEYIKKAYEMNEKYIEEFVILFKDNDLKYNLIVDCLLIANVIEGDVKDIAWLAEMSDTLGITKEEMDAMAKVTIGILIENTELYLKGSKALLDKYDYTMFWCYGKTFVVGCIQEDREITYYYALEKKPFSFAEGHRTFQSKQVIFENLIIDLKEIELIFQSIEKVRFENCEFMGGSKFLKINACKKVEIEGCLFEGFTDSVIYGEADSVDIKNSKFYNCRVDYGGVMHWTRLSEELLIENSEFKDCSSSVCYFSNGPSDSFKGKSKVKNCKFYNCKVGGSYAAFYNCPQSMFENCESVGSQKLWY